MSSIRKNSTFEKDLGIDVDARNKHWFTIFKFINIQIIGLELYYYELDIIKIYIMINFIDSCSSTVLLYIVYNHDGSPV